MLKRSGGPPRQMTIFVAAAGLKRGASLLPATPPAAGERSNVSSRVMVLIKYSAIFNTPCLHVYTVQPVAFQEAV